jgi:hypothetical protein
MVSNWQILSSIVGVLGFVISLMLFVMKLRESVPTLMVRPPEKGFRYLSVRLHNTSKYPITVSRIQCFPSFLLQHAAVDIGARAYDGTGINPCHPFWLLPDEQVTIKYWYEKEEGTFPANIWIIYRWRTQGSWRLPRLPFVVWRRRKDLKIFHTARYLETAHLGVKKD